MKLIFIPAFYFVAINTAAQKDTAFNYNKYLPGSLGADDYGMKMYVLVLLKA